MKPILLTIVICLALWELFALMPVSYPKLSATPYRLGAIHVHSSYSDGGGSVEEIVSDARLAGLDYVVLTDHNSTQARQENKEGRYGRTDLFVESEVSTTVGHALMFYSHTPAVTIPDVQIRNRTNQHYEEKKPLHEDVFLVIAHPNNIKNAWKRLDKGTEGIEVFNFDSFWQHQLHNNPMSFLFTALLFPINNYLGLLRFLQPNPKNLTVWDQMNEIAPGTFGLVAPDAHSRVVLRKGYELRWPSYLMTFRLAANAIRLKDPPKKDFSKRKLQLYQALRSGQSAMVFHLSHPFAGNDWTLQCPDRIYSLGDKVSFKKGCHFVVRLPKTLPFIAQLKMYRGGKLIESRQTDSTKEVFELKEPGNYRLEVWLLTRSPFRITLRKDTPYIFYNPIYVTDS